MEDRTGRDAVAACVQLGLQVKVPVSAFVQWAGAGQAQAAGPDQQLGDFAQQGRGVGGDGVGQRVPTDGAFSVFAAVKFQILQIHRVLFFGLTIVAGCLGGVWDTELVIFDEILSKKQGFKGFLYTVVTVSVV